MVPALRSGNSKSWPGASGRDRRRERERDKRMTLARNAEQDCPDDWPLAGSRENSEMRFFYKRNLLRPWAAEKRRGATVAERLPRPAQNSLTNQGMQKFRPA